VLRALEPLASCSSLLPLEPLASCSSPLEPLDSLEVLSSLDPLTSCSSPLEPLDSLEVLSSLELAVVSSLEVLEAREVSRAEAREVALVKDLLVVWVMEEREAEKEPLEVEVERAAWWWPSGLPWPLASATLEGSALAGRRSPSFLSPRSFLRLPPSSTLLPPSSTLACAIMNLSESSKSSWGTRLQARCYWGCRG